MNVINTRFEAAVSVAELRKHPRNPRQGDTGAIYTSIDRNGFYGACVVQESSGVILAGNHRFDAAKHAGAETVPCIYVDCDDATALRILLADNRHNDLASYDFATLLEVAQEIRIAEGTLHGTGYDDDSLQQIARDLEGYTAQAAEAVSKDPAPGATEVSNAPPESSRPAPEPTIADKAADEVVDKRDELFAKWGTARGQVWRVGPHRLMCGDSRSAEDLDKLLAGEEVHWVWTDPPYGVSYVGKTSSAMTIENDGAEDLDKLLAAVFKQCERVMAPGAPIYIAHPHGPKSLTFAQEFTRAGFHWHQTLVWVKTSIVLGHSDYHYRHEPILYGWKENAEKRVWDGSMYPNRPWFGERNKGTVLEYAKPSRSDLYPTTKPTGLIAGCILNSSAIGALGFEPFSGSGATLLAAHDTGRVVCAMELDPKYVSVALERAEMAGLKPELEA